MAFNLFKKNQQEKPQQETTKQIAEVKEEVASTVPRRGDRKAKKSPVLPGVLLNPHITEKASMLQEMGQYVFRVHKEATKGAVRGAVESLYGVEVQSVRLIRKPAKKIRSGKKMVLKPELKKAVVQLKQGQSIEIISR